MRLGPANPGIAVSVGIVTYNRGPLVDRCLRSVATAFARTPHEVIVVDNASADGTVALLRERHPDVTVVANTSNAGLTVAGNQILARAGGAYVLLLNDDTEVDAGSMEALLAAARERPDTAAVGPRLLYGDGTDQAAHKAFPTPMAALFGRRSLMRRLFPNNRWSRRYLTSAYTPSRTPYEVDSVSLACILLRREALADVGGMDEGFFIYWSDVDWCRRLKARGWKLAVVPAARVIHLEGQMVAKQRPAAIIDFHRGAYRYYRKHDAPGRWHPLGALALAVLTARTLVLLAVNVFRPAPPRHRQLAPVGPAVSEAPPR